MCTYIFGNMKGGCSKFQRAIHLGLAMVVYEVDGDLGRAAMLVWSYSSLDCTEKGKSKR